jgi:hypothetical protein
LIEFRFFDHCVIAVTLAADLLPIAGRQGWVRRSILKAAKASGLTEPQSPAADELNDQFV